MRMHLFFPPYFTHVGRSDTTPSLRACRAGRELTGFMTTLFMLYGTLMAHSEEHAFVKDI